MARGKDTIAASDEHNSRGIELADRGWYDEAIKEFKKAIELDPNSGHAWDNLAMVYAEKKQYRDALDAHLKALAVEPDAASSHANLAHFLAVHGLEFAAAEYQQALELEADYPDAQLNLGLTYADLGRMDEAMAAIRRAIELDPKDPLARQELAGLLMEEGDHRAAITLLKDVTRLEPGNFEAWVDLGICYAQKGFFEEAERAYDKAAGLREDDLTLLYNRAALHARRGQKAEAIALLTKALSMDRKRVLAWLRADPMFMSLAGDPEFEALR
jgi:Flp pilus assembly protein TadD